MLDTLPRAAGIGPGARLRERYRLHEVRVDLVGDDSAVLEWVHAVLEHIGLLPAEEAGGAAEVVLRCSARADAVRMPPDVRLIAEQDGIRAWGGGGQLYLECDGHASRVDLAEGTAECALAPPPASPRKDVILYTLLLLLRRRGLYALHASAVARNGSGYLFAAPCGSGKSTQTYGLVRQGWDYLADDALLLRVSGDEVEALALRRDLCLDPALSHTFPEVSVHGEGGPFAARGKRRLPMRALHPERLIDRTVPRLLVFPEIVAQPTSRLVPLGQAEALAKLIEQSVVFNLDPEVLRQHLGVLERLVRQAPGYRLLAGRDLKEHPEGVAALLASVPGLPAPPPTPRPR